MILTIVGCGIDDIEIGNSEFGDIYISDAILLMVRLVIVILVISILVMIGWAYNLSMHNSVVNKDDMGEVNTVSGESSCSWEELGLSNKQ